jgi:hypothetical protein
LFERVGTKFPFLIAVGQVLDRNCTKMFITHPKTANLVNPVNPVSHHLSVFLVEIASRPLLKDEAIGRSMSKGRQERVNRPFLPGIVERRESL